MGVRAAGMAKHVGIHTVYGVCNPGLCTMNVRHFLLVNDVIYKYPEKKVQQRYIWMENE